MSAVEIETEVEGTPAVATTANGHAAASSALPASDGCVSMSEVYEQMQHDARQAQALAARSGEGLERCTYDQGYITQPMHWCKTCHPGGGVGVCFGCSMNCHLGEEHEVFELFEKRAVRCDCGSRRAGGCCALQPVKDESNPANVYNHNYNGRYCRCDGGYDADRDVMLCCVLCQDWLHERCLLGATAPDETEEGAGTAFDLMCAECLANPKHAILLPYLDLAVREAEATAAQGLSAPNTPSMSRAGSVSGTPLSASRTNSLLRMDASPLAASPGAPSAAASSEERKESASELAVSPSDAAAAALSPAIFATPSRKRKADELSSGAAGTLTGGASSTAAVTAAASSPAAIASPANSSVVCHRPTLSSPPDAAANAPEADNAPVTAAVVEVAAAAPTAAGPRDRFVPSDWNQLLCACPSCVAEYRQHGLLWLLDEETPVPAPAGAGADSGTAAIPSASSSGAPAPGSVLAPMSSADSSAPVVAAFDADRMVASYVERMPRGVAIDIITPFQLFQESIKRGLAEFAQRCPGQVVSGDIMQSIVAAAKAESQEQFQQIKRQRMEGQDTLPE